MTASEPLPIEELYDEPTLRRLGFEVVPLATESEQPATMPSRLGRPLSGLMLAAAMSGVGDMVEPEGRKAAMVEFDPGHDTFRDRPVQFVMVPGSPKASRIILRPWLRAG